MSGLIPVKIKKTACVDKPRSSKPNSFASPKRNFPVLSADPAGPYPLVNVQFILPVVTFRVSALQTYMSKNPSPLLHHAHACTPFADTNTAFSSNVFKLHIAFVQKQPV
jgi:hypothetical protein